MKDTVREEWLTQHGYLWEYVEKVALASVKVDEGVRRQIRLSEKIDDDHVGRLVTALKDGAQLPAVILARMGGSTLELVDGVHRCTAHRHLNTNAIDAYVITNIADKSALEQVRRIANAPVGKGFNTDEAVRQAVTLVQRSKWAPKEAAKALHVSESSIVRQLRAIATDERLATLRPQTNFSTLSVDVRDFLGRIQNDKVLLVCLDTTLDRQFSGATVKEIFRDALTVSSDADANAFIEKITKEYPKSGPRPRFPALRHTPQWNVDHAVISLKRAVTGFDKKGSYVAQLTTDQRAKVAHDLQTIGADLLNRAASLSKHGTVGSPRTTRSTRQSNRSRVARRETHSA